MKKYICRTQQIRPYRAFYAVMGWLGDSNRLDWAAILTDLPRFRAETRPNPTAFAELAIGDCGHADTLAS